MPANALKLSCDTCTCPFPLPPPRPQLYLLAFALTCLAAAAGTSALLMSRPGRRLGLHLMCALAALPGMVLLQVGRMRRAGQLGACVSQLWVAASMLHAAAAPGMWRQRSVAFPRGALSWDGAGPCW